MYQIAICDSEKTESDRVERILRSEQSPLAENAFLLKRFTNTGDLLQETGTENWKPDIILMDINVPEQMGVETVRELHRMGNRGKVILFASSAEYALTAFEVEVASYLIKPVSERALFKAIHKILEDKRDDRHQYILLKVDSHIRKFALNDIVYCEAQGKRQCIHMTDGAEVRQNLTMAKIYEMCCACQELVKVGASYIIHLGHIESMNAQEAQMDNGQKIYLPRGTYPFLRDKYLDYHRGKK